MTQFRSIQNFWISKEWLGNRMLFISGARQTGKTLLVRTHLCKDKSGYFNWDDPKTRRAYRKDPYWYSQSRSHWICFDEIHKRPKWKDILKGAYDVHKDEFRFVITGSARLEVFKRSGDSLVGRYFNTHLFPLNLQDFRRTDFTLPRSPKALLDCAADCPETGMLESLLRLGGFPEPFFQGTESFWKRWSNQHEDLIIREDLRDLTRVVEIDKIDSLVKMIRPCVGGTVSNLHLAQDLETTHGSVKRWLEELSKVQILFPVAPYSRNIRRSYRQEKKWYFVDWRAASTNVFENYIAASLYRAVTLYQDRFGENFSLHFVRTHDGAEVDFLIALDEKPWLLVEAKEGNPDVSRAIYRFVEVLKVPCAIVTPKPKFFSKQRSGCGEWIYQISWEKLGQHLP